MKAREQREMYDEIDIYLGRCLKNWATLQRPLDHSRERLLSSAVAPPEEKQYHFIHLFLKKWLSYLNSEPAFYPTSSGWVVEPFTQSRDWLFHFATLQHHCA